MTAPRPPRWPFGRLEPGAYGLILIDPPTEYVTRSPKGQGRSASRHYQVMSVNEIVRRFPVDRLAARECVLVAWATGDGLAKAIRMVEAWGFRYVTAAAWGKRSRTGERWAFGLGHVFRSCLEFAVVGSRGPLRRGSRSERNLVVAPVREHSRKPDEFHVKLERVFPRRRRCELFARARRPGWECWGREVDKFP